MQNVLIDTVKECSKCGICRSVCPVFLAVNDEVMSPRGRTSLVEAMLEGGLSLSERYMDTIRSCIKCMRCSSTCPSGIRVERIVQSARDLLYESIGVPDSAREVFRAMLLSPKAFHASLLNAFQSPHSSVPLWQLPLFFHGKAYIPKIAEETVLDKYPEYMGTQGKRRASLFLGCSINYANTEIADSALEVLRKLDVEIFLPKEQVCCGAPLTLFGDKDGAKELAERNLKALKSDEFDAVITLCPACGVTLKNEYQRLLGRDIAHFASKIYDISEFIGRFTIYKFGKMDVSVTYHDPCYLRLGQKVINEPRRILDDIARFVEMKDADRCCGLGGALGLFHPEISLKISEAKIKAISESDADMVATGCPGCIMYLRDRLAKKGIRKEVLHTIQILGKSVSSL